MSGDLTYYGRLHDMQTGEDYGPASKEQLLQYVKRSIFGFSQSDVNSLPENHCVLGLDEYAQRWAVDRVMGTRGFR